MCMLRLLLLCCSLGCGLVHAAPVEERYASSCANCHDKGVEGAPRKGDAAAWAARLRQGEPTLLAHVRQGIRGMPPRGLCNDCSDAEFRALITFMSK